MSYFKILFNSLLGMPMNENSKAFRNKKFTALLVKPVSDLIWILIGGFLIFLVFLILDSFVSYESFHVNNPIIPIKDKMNYFDVFMCAFIIRLCYLGLFEIYYWIRKICYSTLVRGKVNPAVDIKNVQLKSIIIIHPIYLFIKIFIEYLVLNLFVCLCSKEFLMSLVDFKVFGLFKNEVITIASLLFLTKYVISIVFTFPLGLAKLISPNCKGNYKFSFLGDAVYVGNADDGITNRLTKYYNNKGADDTGKIYWRRFHTRVFFIITGSGCRFVEVLMYIIHGCPLINKKDCWTDDR